MSKVLIIGGGAAGMLAAISCAFLGHSVSIYEKNNKLGKKLYITGKGRCNLTNASSMQTVFDNVVSNPKFLYTAFKEYTNEDIMGLIEDAGCPLKIERGNRVFPISDKSSDIIKAFEKKLNELNVEIILDTEVKNIIYDKFDELNENGTQKLKYNKIIRGIELSNSKKIYADAVIIATGGYSYKATGSTGDGYKFAKKVGHTVNKIYPSLVPFILKENDFLSLQGLSLKNIGISIKNADNKLIYEDFGEILFTHFGISGPLILSASSYIVKLLENQELYIYLDLKPALDLEKLEKRILRDFEEFKNKDIKNALVKLLPLKLIPLVIDRAGIDENKKVHNISKIERNNLLKAIKELKFTIIDTRGFKEAIITKGGVDVKEINPKSMESKIVKNLYFAGEVLDLDALTGGFNLQIAFSTAWIIGGNIEYV